MRAGERGWEGMEGGGRNKTKEKRKISLVGCLKMINSDCLQGRDTGKGVKKTERGTEGDLLQIALLKKLNQFIDIQIFRIVF